MTFDILVSLVAIFFLLLLSAGFSASETAFIAASRIRIHHSAKAGSKRAKIVNSLRSDMGKLLSFLLLANTLVNIFGASLATFVFTKAFGEVGVAYAPIAMTFLVVIFAEVIPKIYALNYAEVTAKMLAPLIKLFIIIFSPLSNSVDTFARFLLKFLGFHVRDVNGSTATAEELRGIIEMHALTGAKAAQERRMLRSVLDLAEVEVGDVMIHRKNVMMIDISQKPSKIVKIVLNSPYTRIPLYQENKDNIVGILHTKAFFRAIAAHPVDVDSMDILSTASKPWFVPETTNLLDQLQAFRARKELSALVVDEYGAFLGVVTLEDILEEIVGEITDEVDVELPGVTRTQDGAYIVEGTTTIRDLNRQFEWELPDEEAATIAGLILHESRQIPHTGQIFSFYGLEIKILRRIRNQITLVRITQKKTSVTHK